MICKNCGTNNAEGVRFCAGCGSTMDAPAVGHNAAPSYEAPVNHNAPVSHNTPGYGAPATPAHHAPTYGSSAAKAGSMLPLAGIGLVAAVVVILLFSLLFGNSAKSVAKKAAKYAINGKYYSISKLYHKEVRKENEWDDEDYKEDCKDMEEDWKENMRDLREEEGRVKLSTKIKDIDDIKGDDLDDIQDYYDDEYDLKVKKAKRFETEFCAEIDGEEEEYDDDIIVVKIGGKWYLYDGASIF